MRRMTVVATPKEFAQLRKMAKTSDAEMAAIGRGHEAWANARKKVKHAKVRSEQSIQNGVLRYAKRDKQKHWRCFKRSRSDMFGSNGEPDFEFIHKTCAKPGRRPHICTIEFKKPGEGPTGLQWEKIKELRALGIPTTPCDDVKEGVAWLKDQEKSCGKLK